MATQSKISDECPFFVKFSLIPNYPQECPPRPHSITLVTLLKLYPCHVQSGSSLRKGAPSRYPTPKRNSVDAGCSVIVTSLGLVYCYSCLLFTQTNDDTINTCLTSPHLPFRENQLLQKSSPTEKHKVTALAAVTRIQRADLCLGKATTMNTRSSNLQETLQKQKQNLICTD